MSSTRDIDLEAPPAVLGAFLRAVATAGDSPTVIRRVAENAAYVKLCRCLATLQDDDDPPALLVEACRKADITLPRLRARLAPVARALGLLSDDDRAAYYRVLGVPPDSDAETIRSAYRRRARELHPDLQPGRHAEPLEFAVLNEAYATLRDPGARQAYDARHRPQGTWFEADPQQPPPKPPRRYPFTAFVVVVMVLVAVALVLDQLERESAQRIAFRTSRSTATQPVAPPPGQPAPPLDAPSAPEPEPAQSDAVPPPAATPLQPLTAASVLVAARVSKAEAAPPEDEPASVQKPPPAVPAPESPAAFSPAPRRVSLFYAAGTDGRLADELRRLLAAKGFPPPRTAPSAEARRRTSNVRYFNAADRKAALDLQSAVRRFMVDVLDRPQASVGLIDLSRRYPDARAGLLEVWLNTGAPMQDAAAADTLPTPPNTILQAAAAAPPAAKPSTEDRIRRFLETYCRTYESRAPERLAALFEPTATENGRPFTELLPRYRVNMAKMAKVSYRIAMESWQPVQDGAGLEVQGRFTASGELPDRREYRSRGSIRLTLVPHKDAFRVARLAYAID